MSRPAAPRRILVSLGKSAPGDGGIFEFSSQLARRIVLAAPAWRERWNVEFTLHLRPQLLGHFGPGVAYLPLVRLQRLVHLQPLPYALWHSLNQLNRFRPPRGCGRRLVTVHTSTTFTTAAAGRPGSNTGAPGTCWRVRTTSWPSASTRPTTSRDTWVGRDRWT